MHGLGVFGHLLQQVFFAFGPDLVVTVKARRLDNVTVSFLAPFYSAYDLMIFPSQPLTRLGQLVIRVVYTGQRV